MKKGVKIAIILGTIGVTGVGAYFLWKKVIKPKLDEKKDKDKEEKRPPIDESSVKTTTYNKRPQSDLGATPFKSQAEGDKFRKWINDTYPKYAKEIDLDPSGSYDNRYIRKAWAKYGVEYKDAKANEGAVYNVTYGQNFANLLKAWKKTHFLSESDSTKGVPYFQLNAGDNIGSKYCDLKMFVYDRKKGENVGGKDGWGYWKIVRTGHKGKVPIAWGRYNKYLTNLKVDYARTYGGKKLSSSGQTYSGGKEVGGKIAQIIHPDDYDKRGFKWC
jgi:hypothetical protein